LNFIWVLNVTISTWLSFPHCVIHLIVSNGVLITNVLSGQKLIKCDFPLPWSYFHARKPNNFFLSLYHCSWTFTCIPWSELLTFSINFHHFFILIFERVVNWEVDSVLVPAVIKDNIWNITTLAFLLTAQVLSLMQRK
jgi:hypothetical protein